MEGRGAKDKVRTEYIRSISRLTQAAHDMYEREDMAVRLRTLPRLSTYIGVVEGGEGKRGREEEGNSILINA